MKLKLIEVLAIVLGVLSMTTLLVPKKDKVVDDPIIIERTTVADGTTTRVVIPPSHTTSHNNKRMQGILGYDFGARYDFDGTLDSSLTDNNTYNYWYTVRHTLEGAPFGFTDVRLKLTPVTRTLFYIEACTPRIPQAENNRIMMAMKDILETKYNANVRRGCLGSWFSEIGTTDVAVFDGWNRVRLEYTDQQEHSLMENESIRLNRPVNTPISNSVMGVF